MKMLTIHHAAIVAAATVLPHFAAAQAQPASDAMPEETIQSVRVNGVRDPAMMPYEQVYDMLTKAERASGGKVLMTIRITSAKNQQPIPGLEVGLRGDNNYERLALSTDGFLTVPLRRDLIEDKAVFLTNKRKGSLKLEIFFVPRFPDEQIRYGDIAASIVGARKARSMVAPWYLRPLFPAIDEVRFCYPHANELVRVSGSSPGTRPASVEQKSYMTKDTVYCAAFTIKETEAERDKLITLPTGWVALFWR